MTLEISTTSWNGTDIPTTIINNNHANPLIIYHHGLYGSKDGDHGQNLAQQATEMNCGFLAFNNLGHGLNPTVPLEDADMKKWVSVAKHMITKHAGDRNLILVGNSWGAGVLCNAVGELKRPIDGFIGISAAPDVIQREIQAFFSANLPANDKQSLQNGEQIYASFPPAGNQKIPLSRHFFDSAQQHSIFEKQYQFDCPAVLIRGTKDPYITTKRTQEFLSCFNGTGQVIEVDDGHDLSSSASRQQIAKAVNELARTAKTLQYA